jgi:DNA polymerase V
MNGRPAFILLDANNFYASCEKVWRPELANKPVVVAGSGDGCVIARSDEAKAIGIKMGTPLHEVRDEYWRSGVIICSANFPLYGDMSSRMMRSIATLAPSVTVYSIDKSKVYGAGIQTTRS